METEDFTLTEAVSTITWTAQSGTRIEPGQFQEFEVSAGRMPEVDSISFPAEQTYEDGTVVSWADPVVDGEEEPEHPAPTLRLAPASDGSDEHGGGSDEPAETVTPARDADPVASTTGGSSDGGSDTTARLLGGAGLLLGAAGLVVAVLGSRRRAAR